MSDGKKNKNSSAAAGLAQALSAGTDKKSLIKLIDGNIIGIISTLAELPSGSTIPKETMITAQEALQLLEACSSLGDEEFTSHARKRAKQLHEAIKAVMEGNPVKVPRKKKKKKKKKKKEDDAPEESSDPTFESEFKRYFCRFIEERFECWNLPITIKPEPFILSSSFTAIFCKAIGKYLVPELLQARRILALAPSVDLENPKEGPYYAEFLKPAADNIPRQVWVDAFKDLKKELNKPAMDEGTEKSDKKPDIKKNAKEEKPGLLSRLFKKKDTKTKKSKSLDPVTSIGMSIWKDLEKGSKEFDFEMPVIDDIDFLLAVFEIDPDLINENKKAFEMTLIQEKNQGSETEPGSSRDLMSSYIDELPLYNGELIALWAYFRLDEFFTEKIHKSILAMQGQSSEQRSKAMPLFTRWTPDPF